MATKTITTCDMCKGEIKEGERTIFFSAARIGGRVTCAWCGAPAQFHILIVYRDVHKLAESIPCCDECAETVETMVQLGNLAGA